MAYSSSELRERGVDETIIAFRRLRRRLGLTQGEAAAMAGVNERTLSNAERGRTRPQCATRGKLRNMIERWQPIARKLERQN